MRVKLSYTVEEEDVLKEAAKIINLSTEDMQQVIKLFQDVQTELRGEASEVVNVHKALEVMDEMRKALLAIDTRLLEVTEIVSGFDDYRKNQKEAQNLQTAPPQEQSHPMADHFGTD